MKKSCEFLAAITVTFALVACQDERSDAQYVASANNRITAGDLRGATIELKNALQQNPQNLEARCLLGEVYLREGNAAGAEKELIRASELGVSEDTVLPSLARALLTLGKYDELEDLPADKMNDGGQRALVLAAKGLGKLAEGDSGAAAELVDQAVSLAPESVYVVVARAQVMFAANETQLARQELEKAFTLDANYAPAWSLTGDLHSASNELTEAEQAYSKAIDSRSNDLITRFKRALIRIRQTDFEGAQSDIDALKTVAPRSLEASYAQGLLSFNTRDFKKAQAAFDDVLVFDDKNASALFYLAYTHLLQNNLDQAEHYVDRFVALAPNSVAGQVLLASISFEKGDFAKAERLVSPIVRTQPNNQLATDLLARALIQQQKPTEAIGLLKGEVDRQPDSASTRLRLAVVLLASDAIERGTAVIEEALALDPKLTQAHILRVTNLLNQKAFAKAVDAAKAFVAQYPQSSMAHDMMGAAYLQSGQLDDAKRAFMRANELAPGDLTANRNLAQMAIAQKDYVAARGFYSNILSKDMGNLYALLDLAALDATQNDEKGMVARLEEAAKANPGASQPRLMLARYYLARGKAGQVPGVMRELSETASNTPAALEVTAQYQLSQRNFEEAQVTATKLIQAKPDNAQAHFILAWAYDGLRDRDNARKSLEKSVELAPDHFSARMALAYLLLVDGETKLAENQLGVLTKRAPEHPGVLKLKAALAGSEGNQEGALDLLQDVFEKYPSTTSLASLVEQKRRMADPEGALALQERWLEQHPDDAATLLSLAGGYEQRNEVDKAITKLKQLLAKDENNVVVLNELAWQMREQDPKTALKYATKAADLAPAIAEIQDTLAVVLLKNGQVDQARRALDRGLNLKPKHPSLRYHSALIDAAAGKRDAAVQTLEALLGELVDFPEKEDAEKLLVELSN